MTKQRMGWTFLLLALVLTPTLAMAGQKHDSAIFLIDVSETVVRAKKITEAQRIVQSMNNKFPDWVKSAGALIFGNLATPTSEWIAPVTDYDRKALDQAFAGLKAGNGSTPMGTAILKSAPGIEAAKGKKALIIVSDGLDNDDEIRPVAEVKALKAKYGDDVCVFTIQLGDRPMGTALLKRLVDAGGCGTANAESELQSDSGVQSLVDVIFKGTGPAKARIDSDGDGVYDDEDMCPNTPKGAKVDKRGCWVLQDLRFETGKANILPKYTAELDNAVKVLKENPDLKITIEGHTDSVGSDEMNMDLSNRRAESVFNYMVDKGVDKDRLSTKGYGKTKPIASNDTAEGRAKNRRVELTVVQ